ncbi:MAG: glycosyltransferase [Methylotenera sp.]|uniref:glycosyltransferase n=1 Tax=Methylotenera sp. TaxID=2051956 RepID=UPI00248790A4|nr:glycosyltransferase [Methylotenera sp.]MDI1307817.1 glycosyltransferase [Methylotenera sp.]
MSSKLLKVFIGYDQVESVAWHTMAHSILTRSSQPVSIIPVNLTNLKDIYTRERDPKQSNEFSFSRFLVPYLSDYEGYAAFFDCDMMLRTDINEMFNVAKQDPGKAVYVVKHDYEPRDDIKYLNNVQYKYPKKNWSSVVLWDCSHPANRVVTPDFVNTATPMDLHRFTWLKDDEIGGLNVRWNWLVGEYDQPPADVKNVHWTVGGPYFEEYKNVDFSEEWFAENKEMAYCLQRQK